MANPVRIQELGNSLAILFDDGTKRLAYPTVGGLWIVGVAPTSSNPPTGDIYNPWVSWNVTGSWANHGTYSSGGIDYPLPYGTALLAPAAGTVRSSGGSGEFAAGWVGSAGRRAVLELSQSYPRVQAKETYPMEGDGPLTHIVVQHLSAFVADGTVNKGDLIGYSGASANGADYGGDVHLHVHGLQSNGQRVDFLKFIP